MRTELEKMLAGELYDPLDVELVRDVVDDSEAWRDDPRYTRWKTDPYLEAALKPAR